MDRVRYLRLTVAAAVALALAAAVGMSLVRSSGEGRGEPALIVGTMTHANPLPKELYPAPGL